MINNNWIGLDWTRIIIIIIIGTELELHFGNIYIYISDDLQNYIILVTSLI